MLFPVVGNLDVELENQYIERVKTWKGYVRCLTEMYVLPCFTEYSFSILLSKEVQQNSLLFSWL